MQGRHRPFGSDSSTLHSAAAAVLSGSAARRWPSWALLGVTIAGTASAQPPAEPAPPEPLPPVPEQSPPPEAPPAQWAPPLPVEPEPEPAPPPAPAAPPSAAPGDAAAAAAAGASSKSAEEEEEDDQGRSTELEIYGHVMTDVGISFLDVGDPDWFDVLRPSKLPTTENEFGKDPRAYFGVRQTRFGVRTATPTSLGELETMFEWELFGVGDDAGQTTFRLRHAYGSIGQFGAGQYWSPFMDIDVFPNSIEYWGPNAMVFFRNVQLRWMPIQGDSRVTIALERPGADADLGDFEEEVEIAGVVGRYPYPDVSAEARLAHGMGYVELAGLLRFIGWDALTGTGRYQHAIGWGLNLTSNLEFPGKHVLRLAAVYGRGIQSYMNDGGADIGVEIDPADPAGIKGVALPILTGLAFFDVVYSDFVTSTFGWGGVWIDNSNGQEATALHVGHYALANVLFHPLEQMFIGPEVQYARRESFRSDFTANELRVQVSAKFSYSKTFGGL